MAKWTDEDIEILKNNYIYGQINNICELLKNKFTYNAITSKAGKLGISCRYIWTDEELKILYNFYPIKTPDEMLILLPNRNKKTIIMKACELNIRNIVTQKLWFSDDDIDFIYNNWKTMSDDEIGNIIGRTPHAISDKRSELGLLRCADKSSYDDLSVYVRRNNLEWKKESMKACNYKCVITGKRFDDIHHLQGVNLILNDVMSFLNIKIKQTMDDYTKNELTLILKTYRNFQDKYPLGVCLTKEIHNLFHGIYGFGNNTISQWNEFVTKYKSNKFDICKV